MRTTLDNLPFTVMATSVSPAPLNSTGKLAKVKVRVGLGRYGIGAEAQIRAGCATITRLLPGGPAERSATVHIGDRIVWRNRVDPQG